MINGKLYPQNQAKISVLDHGLTIGDGIFETLRTNNNEIHKFNEHYARLQHSARAIKLPIKITKQQLKQQIQATLKANHLNQARIRVTITRGIGPAGLSTNCHNQSIIITASKLKKMPKTGIKAITTNLHLSNPEIKSLSYLPNVLTNQKARQQKAIEALLINNNQQATEGSFSNLFIVHNNTLITPKEKILKGITRQEVIALAINNNIKTKETTITKKQLEQADEIFITFTTQGIIPITQLNKRKLPVGNITKKLIAEYEN
jgi:branched-chain amino acid aminotransferase